MAVMSTPKVAAVLAAMMLLCSITSVNALEARVASPPRSLTVGSPFETLSTSHVSCPLDQQSCSGGSSNSCCYEGTNGLLAQVQLWEKAGPAKSFTIHGLWPDKCDGGYNSGCNPDWDISSAEQTLEGLGMDSLIKLMNVFWASDEGSNSEFWTHEWNKHGTCMYTMAPSCFDGPKNANVGAFYSTVYSLFAQLPTYQWLEEGGIYPKNDEDLDVDEAIAVLAKHTGGVKSAYFDCAYDGKLLSVYYYFYVEGPISGGTFVYTEAPESSNCYRGKFKWFTKSELWSS